MPIWGIDRYKQLFYMTYNEYRVEFRVFRRDGNEYQMRKIPLKEDSDEEARQVLVEMGYIQEDDKINIISITSSSDYYNNSSDNNYPSKSLFFTIGDFIFETAIGKFIGFCTLCILIFIGFNVFFKGNSNVSSIEDARSYLDGKTFMSTPRGDIWYKLSFSGGNCRLQIGRPEFVGWNNKYSGGYSIKEDRYTNTGKIYYYAKFGEGEGFDCLMFDIKKKTLYTCMSGDSPLAIMEVGDRDPWN
jgi:hypothetical protein